MHTLSYSLVYKSALINLLNKSSPLRWRILNFCWTLIHQFCLGIFFPTSISQSRSPEEAVRTSSPHNHLLHSLFDFALQSITTLHVLSESGYKISFQMKPALTTAACRNASNQPMDHGAPEKMPQGIRASAPGWRGASPAGNRALGALQLLQWQEAASEAAAPSRPGSWHGHTPFYINIRGKETF